MRVQDRPPKHRAATRSAASAASAMHVCSKRRLNICYGPAGRRTDPRTPRRCRLRHSGTGKGAFLSLAEKRCAQARVRGELLAPLAAGHHVGNSSRKASFRDLFNVSEAFSLASSSRIRIG